MMTEEQAEAMNDMTVYQARLLYITCDLVTVCGNGQVVSFCDKDKVKEKEKERCEHGY